MHLDREHPESKPTAEDLVLIFLAEYLIRAGDLGRNADVLTPETAPPSWAVEVTPWHIEYKLQQYAVERFSKHHRGSTYLRRWRDPRQNNRLDDIGVTGLSVKNDANIHEQTVWTLRTYREQFFEAIRGEDSPLTFGPQSDPAYDPQRDS